MIRVTKAAALPEYRLCVELSDGKDFDVITFLLKRRAKGVLLNMTQAIGPVELAPRNQPGWTEVRTGSRSTGRELGAIVNSKCANDGVHWRAAAPLRTQL